MESEASPNPEGSIRHRQKELKKMPSHSGTLLFLQKVVSLITKPSLFDMYKDLLQIDKESGQKILTIVRYS